MPKYLMHLMKVDPAALRYNKHAVNEGDMPDLQQYP